MRRLAFLPGSKFLSNVYPEFGGWSDEPELISARLPTAGTSGRRA